MAEEKNIFIENMKVLASPEGMQKYLFGTKKNGTPRAVYDIVKDYTDPKKSKKKKKHKKKNKHNNDSNTSFEFYLQNSKSKKKKNKMKYWHI